MPSQHAALTPERWSAFTLDQQILMIANEMVRALKQLGASDRSRLLNCYERVLNLTDLTIAVNGKPTLQRELLRWRDLVAALYVSERPRAEEHEAALRCLLYFTPEASKQVSLVLGPARRKPTRE